MNPVSSPVARIGVVLAVQLALVGLAVAPQLSARVAGEEYLLRVAPVDPIDPFRGAYVALDYPDLRLAQVDNPRASDDDDRGTLYVSLTEEVGVWVASGTSRQRPVSGTYLTCDDRDLRIRCGIESLFLAPDEARAVELSVGSGDAVARVRIDGRGNAALMGLESQ